MVDNDDVNRSGLTVVLGASPHIIVVAAVTHQEAMDRGTLWHGADVVIIDPADHRQEGDQFPGVAVVRQIRAIRPPGDLVIIVITGHFFDDALRRRMREARADYYYHRGDVADAARLRGIVLSAGRARGARGNLPAPADPEALIRLGVTDSTRVNRAVKYALEMGLERELRERRDPRSRRWLRLRHGFNAEARLTPMTSDGRLPDRRQDVPSLPQISRFLQWAMKIKSGGVSIDDPFPRGDDDLAKPKVYRRPLPRRPSAPNRCCGDRPGGSARPGARPTNPSPWHRSYRLSNWMVTYPVVTPFRAPMPFRWPRG